MATENEKYSFIETLNKFRNGEVIEISDILEKRDAVNIASIVDGILARISILEEQNFNEVQYEIEKQAIKFFYGLLQCTSLEVKNEDIDKTNYDLDFENYILLYSPSSRKIYEIVDNILERRNFAIFDSLLKEFHKMPDISEIEKMEKGLNDIFKDRKEGELKMINEILSFNDPTMKAIKNAITAPIDNAKLKGLDKNGDNITKG